MSRAASLPAAWGRNSQKSDFSLNKPLVPGSFAAWGRTFSQKSHFFEQATCLGQLRCLGHNFSSKIRLSLNKPLVPGSCAARGRAFSQKSDFFEEAICPGRLGCQGPFFFLQKSDCFANITSTISKHALSESLGSRFAEHNVENLKHCTFRNSGTPVRRTKRRKSQKMHF